MPVPIVAYTEIEYQTLSSAVASGALTVEYGDKKVTYRSLDDMLRILSIMKAQLYPDPNNNNGRRFANFSKGTDSCRRRRIL